MRIMIAKAEGGLELEVKLPTTWTNGKAEVGRVREEKRREEKGREDQRRSKKIREDQRRSEKRKSQKESERVRKNQKESEERCRCAKR